MATKKTTQKTTASRKKTASRKDRKPAEVLRDTWSATLAALTSAEKSMEARIRELMKKNKISSKDAAAMLKDFRARADKERKKALKELESRLAKLQARLKKERKNAARMVNDAVQGTLAALNIPSRQEITELTRKVDELSRKIDSVRKR